MYLPTAIADVVAGKEPKDYKPPNGTDFLIILVVIDNVVVVVAM
jgi:hypothetical protein